MSLSKAQILSFASFLALDLENATTLSDYFDDVVEAWAMSNNPPFWVAALVELTADTCTYDFESDMCRLLFSFFDDAPLLLCSEQSLKGYDNDWSAATGTPVAITTDFLNSKYRLYPCPDATSGSTGGLSQPWGEDYPDDILAILYADSRSSAIEELFAIPLALSALSREFTYHSLQEDISFSEVCSEISNLFMGLLGY